MAAAMVVVSIGVLGALMEQGIWTPQHLFDGSPPPLPALLAAAPSPAYYPEAGGPMSGYLTPAQIERTLGVPALRGGLRIYARTWIREDLRSSVVAAVMLAQSASDAERTVARLYSFCAARGGGRVQVPQLIGLDAGGCAVSAILPPKTDPGFYAVVARSRLALVFMVSAPEESDAEALGEQLAQSTAARFAPDPGNPESDAPADTFEYSAVGSSSPQQEIGGLLIAAVLLLGLRIALNRWVLGNRLG